MVIPFQDKSTILVAGASQSGKTILLRDILLHPEDMFKTTPTVCIFVFSHWQSPYEAIKEKWGDRVLFTQKIPSEEQVEEVMKGHKHGLFVADDKGSEVNTSPFFVNLLCRLSHHCQMTSFCLLQDANFTSKTGSTLKKNFHVIILLRSPRERGFVRALGMQLGEYKCLIEAYDDAVKEKYGYICIDLHPAADSNLKYRTNIVPNSDQPCIVYRPKAE